jgi:hypothetical protein
MSNERYPIERLPGTNPYLLAGALVFRRFLWDIKPESWRSRRKLLKWKNRFFGQKAVIVCNGPSLLRTDLSLLKNTFTFGLNKIDLLFDKSDFRPSCIVAINLFVIEQNEWFYNKTEIPLFLDSKGCRNIRPRENITFLHSAGFPKFAGDCSMSVYIGSTVTFVAMQLAFHMGFRDVALIGCDHNFVSKGYPHRVLISGSEDPDHFDPGYFSDGVKWNFPDLLGSELYYMMARNVFHQAGRKIVNATEGGKLEVFPRVSLKDFF